MHTDQEKGASKRLLHCSKKNNIKMLFQIHAYAENNVSGFTTLIKVKKVTEPQISQLESCDHVTLKTGVMMLKIQPSE